MVPLSRSVAFAELVAKQMRLQHPHIHVNVVHLDHTDEYLQTASGCSQQACEDLFEEPYANTVHILRRNLLPELLNEV